MMKAKYVCVILISVIIGINCLEFTSVLLGEEEIPKFRDLPVEVQIYFEAILRQQNTSTSDQGRVALRKVDPQYLNLYNQLRQNVISVIDNIKNDNIISTLINKIIEEKISAYVYVSSPECLLSNRYNIRVFKEWMYFYLQPCYNREIRKSQSDKFRSFAIDSTSLAASINHTAQELFIYCMKWQIRRCSLDFIDKSNQIKLHVLKIKAQKLAKMSQEIFQFNNINSIKCFDQNAINLKFKSLIFNCRGR